MQNKKLLDQKKIQELKNKKFVSKTAKALLIVILFAAVFLIVQQVSAQTDTFGLQSLQEINLPSSNLGVVVARIINAALGLLGLVAVTIILYGGFTWMTARGEVEKVQKAKKILIQATIGLLIVVFSFAIAQFVFFLLGINVWGGGGGGGGGTGGGGGGGALGAGIIRSHYPARNAKDVPRNTKISITFKEGVCSLILDTNKNGVYGDCIGSGAATVCDLMNPAYIRIRKKADLNGPYLTAVTAKTLDNKTFVFTPVDYLGNDQTPTAYTVEFLKTLRYTPSCVPGGFGGYSWNFEVSTKLDLIPPQITSVIPKALVNPGTVARNTVIQINFNEPMDPTTLGGKLQIIGGGKTGTAFTSDSYNLMTVKIGAEYVAGEFYFSNQYRTVEFITTDPCGTNSCGNQVFCLPGAAEISVLIKAATTQDGKPTAIETGGKYDGLIDMCSNSFDGNGNGTADGPRTGEAYSLNIKSVPAPGNNPASAGDNASWQFNTNDLIDLIPPQIETRDPDVADQPILADADLNLSFDKILLFDSVLSGVSLILDQGSVQNGTKVLTEDQYSGYWFEKNEIGDKTTVIIRTSGLANDYFYNVLAKSGIKDNTQNCFLPCADCPPGAIGCNCKRKETAIIGQYEVDSPWSGTYPNCNLAQ